MTALGMENESFILPRVTVAAIFCIIVFIYRIKVIKSNHGLLVK